MFGFWTWTDRLDLPKSALLLGAATVGVAREVVRGQSTTEAAPVYVAGALLVAAAAWPTEMAARVEGWAPLAAALAVGWLARRADAGGVAWRLGAAAVALAVIALLQATGVAPLGGTGVVSGTCGGPAHLGWTLAVLLPFCAALPPAAVAPVVAALVLSGSRTGWVMAVAAAPWWVDRPRLAWAAVGGAAAVALGTAGERVVDLLDPNGTAHGRWYLWRLYLSDPTWWLGLGGGPEAFVRRFPSVQDAFLAAHPADARFRSVLEHAHVDAVEVGANFGVVGLAALGASVARWWRVGEGPSRGALVALAVGGLASPVLFFAPTLAVGAVAGGSCAARSPPSGARRGAIVLLAALLVGDAWMARRVVSEVVRSEATWARVHGDRATAAERAARAAELDPRNPRAWIEAAAACSSETCRDDALRRAARDLPSW